MKPVSQGDLRLGGVTQEAMRRAAERGLKRMAEQPHACFCTGPKPGMPACPCRMRNMTKVEGRWVEMIDHGPVQERSLAERIKSWNLP